MHKQINQKPKRKGMEKEKKKKKLLMTFECKYRALCESLLYLFKVRNSFKITYQSNSLNISGTLKDRISNEYKPGQILVIIIN